MNISVASIKKAISLENTHTLGVLLSLMSTFFGVVREILLVYLLGFSHANDILQIYLSLYFVICLFSDPLRLSYLNLISVRFCKQLFSMFLFVVFIFILFFITAMFLMQPNLNGEYVFLAAFDGFLGIFATLLIFHKQRFGAYLSAQLIGVFPNVVLIPAVVILAFFPEHFFVIGFLLAFMMVHLIQLFLLMFIRIVDDESEKISVRADDMMFLLRHCLSILGEQLFQIVGRLLFLRIGQGFVTYVSLFMKCFLTFRSVFVDSYIGVKISTWSSSASRDLFFELMENKSFNLSIALITFIICFFDTHNFYLMGFQFLALSLMSYYFSTLHRVVYFKLNRHFHYTGLVTFTGLFDLFGALFVFFCFKYNVHSHMMLFVYFWYGLRLFIEINVLRLYGNKFLLDLKEA
ncbi:MAG: hypothetical protein ACRCXC_05545 [Legionella sp.]